METGIWAYREDIGYRPGMDLTGFEVEAADGRIGKVDKHNDEADAGHLVVDTGVWIFGKHVLLPVGTISSVDPVARVVRVDRGKQEIRNAPEFDRGRHEYDPAYHELIGTYYYLPRPRF